MPLCLYCSKRWYYKDEPHQCPHCLKHSHAECVRAHVLQSLAESESFPACQECGHRLETNAAIFPLNIPADDNNIQIEDRMDGGEVCWNAYRRLDSNYVERLSALDRDAAEKTLSKVASFAPWRGIWLHGKICPALAINNTVILERPVDWFPFPGCHNTSSVNSLTTVSTLSEPSLPVPPLLVCEALSQVEGIEAMQVTTWRFYQIDTAALAAFANHSHGNVLRLHFDIPRGDAQVFLQICDIPPLGRRLGRVSMQGPQVVNMTRVEEQDFVWSTGLD